MQAVLVALKSAGSLLGVGGAGAATAGGVGTLAATLGTAGTIYSTLYSMKLAKVQEQTALENSKRASFAGQVSAQDADIEAAAAIAAEQEGRAFSGFASTSGSFQRADRRNRVMARRDATRIVQDAQLESSRYKAEAAEARAERRNIGLQGFFDTLGGAIEMKSSLIADSSLVSARKTRAINRVSNQPSTPPNFAPITYNKKTPRKLFSGGGAAGAR